MQTQAHTISPAHHETTSQPATWKRVAARWMATFLGFPIGGYAAYLISGPVDGLTAALIGGAITGAILGAAQAWGLRLRGAAARHWIAATAAGLMVGLAVGAAVVGYHTDLIDLVVQGAITGLAVGAAQGVLLRERLGRLAWAWPPLLSVSVRDRVGRHHRMGHRRRRAVHHLRRQRCAGRHRRHHRPARAPRRAPPGPGPEPGGRRVTAEEPSAPWPMDTGDGDSHARSSVFKPHGFLVLILEDTAEAGLAKAALHGRGLRRRETSGSTAASRSSPTTTGTWPSGA